jgi:hypothetical protein
MLPTPDSTCLVKNAHIMARFALCQIPAPCTIRCRNIAISGISSHFDGGQTVCIAAADRECHQDRLRAIEIDRSSHGRLLQRTMDSPASVGRQDEVVGYLAHGGRCSPTYTPPWTGMTLSDLNPA